MGSLRGDSDFTVALLAKQASPPLRYAVLASKDIGREGACPFRLELVKTGFVGFVGLGIPSGKPGPCPDAADLDGYSTALTSRRKLELSAWTHIAVTRCGTAFTLNIDGSPDASLDVPFTQEMDHDNVLDLRIGCRHKPHEPLHPVRPMFGELLLRGHHAEPLFIRSDSRRGCGCLCARSPRFDSHCSAWRCLTCSHGSRLEPSEFPLTAQQRNSPDH